MRITPSMMMNKYQKTLDDNLSRLNDESSKIYSERKFTRASQDPVAAVKALRTARQLDGVTQYQQSVKEADSWVTNTESSLNTIDKILVKADSMITQAKNGTYSTDDAQTQANSLKSYQQELIETLNGVFNGQYTFGGSSSGSVPFKLGTADDLTGGKNPDMADTSFTQDQVVGKLLFNIPNTSTYVPVSAINNSASGQPGYAYSINNPALKITMPVDLGLGIKTDSTHTVVNGTAFDAATSPLDFLVLHPDGTSSTNIVDALGNAANLLGNSTSAPDLDDALSLVQDAQNAELKSTVSVGEKSKMLDFLSNKLTNDNTNLTGRLSAIEDIDITQESTVYYMDQMVYNASLSISSNVLQHSLIDFLK